MGSKSKAVEYEEEELKDSESSFSLGQLGLFSESEPEF